MNSEKVVLFTGLDPGSFGSLGKILHRPAVRLVPDKEGLALLPARIGELKKGTYDHLLFSDRFAVPPFRDALENAALPESLRIIAAGNGTPEALEQQGIRFDAVRIGTGTEGLIGAFDPSTARRILVIEGTHTPKDLVEAGKERGWTMERVAVARILSDTDLGPSLPDHDAIYFVAPAAVRRYHETFGVEAFKKEVLCMGGRVLEEVRRLGGEGVIENPIKKRR